MEIFRLEANFPLEIRELPFEILAVSLVSWGTEEMNKIQRC
jgi:hypothetical protein